MPEAQIVCAVEGDGDVHAAPVLIRRIAAVIRPDLTLEIKTWRIQAGKILAHNWSQFDLAANFATRSGGRLLVLLDSDCEPSRCPRELGPKLQGKLDARAGHLRPRLVLAHCEFETWFLAALPSLCGHAGLGQDLTRPRNWECKRDAKGWLAKHMHGGYRETLHQARFAGTMDLNQAQHCRSFRKFRQEIAFLLGC